MQKIGVLGYPIGVLRITQYTQRLNTRLTSWYLEKIQLPSNLSSSIDPLYNFNDYPKELKYRLQVACNDARTNLILMKIVLI